MVTGVSMSSLAGAISATTNGTDPRLRGCIELLPGAAFRAEH